MLKHAVRQGKSVEAVMGAAGIEGIATEILETDAAAPPAAVRAAERVGWWPWAAQSLPLDLPLSGCALAGRRARVRRLS